MAAESRLERKLLQAVAKAGGIAFKFTSATAAGVPDRICLFSPGVTVFVEMKAPGEKPTPLQAHMHHTLRTYGHFVYVIDSEERIADMINNHGC